jgi:hypothetical protein
MSSVLRLGVYRERIEKYGGSRPPPPALHPGGGGGSGAQNGGSSEEVLTVTLERQPGLHLGIRYSQTVVFALKISYKNINGGN